MKNHCLILSSKHVYDHGRNVGAYSIASHLRRNGWDCTVVDYFLQWNQLELIEYLKKHITNDTKWVGISYTWLFNRQNTNEALPTIHNLIQNIKKINPNVLLIAGGQSPYDLDLDVDYYIYGYAEHAILKILDYEFNDGAPIFYTKLFGGKFVDAIHNYASYNLPTYTIDYEDTDFISKGDVLSVEFSRGCKFKCDFCTFPFIGIKEDTSTSEELLYRELMTNYHTWGVKTYIVTDETVNDRIEKLIKIKNVVNRLDFKPDFTAFARADLFRSHPEAIELMAECRIWGHYYGVETFNQKSGKVIGKGQNPEYIKESLLKVKDYFQKNLGQYRGTISMIGGLPHESLDSLRESYKWLVENWSDQNVAWWTLQIVDNGNLSAMGKDFASYGYKKLDVQANSHRFSTLGLNNTEIYWENEHTNIFEIDELFRKEFTHKFYLDNFKLWFLLPYAEYEKSKNYRVGDDWEHLVHQAKIQEYINNKKHS
jgi:radical SAM superfamily enzyme YgiQ (UPF0313 family)